MAIKLQTGRDDAGRLLAVIYEDCGDDIVVLDVEVIKNDEDGRAWFARMAIERPWESRQ